LTVFNSVQLLSMILQLFCLTQVVVKIHIFMLKRILEHFRPEDDPTSNIFRFHLPLSTDSATIPIELYDPILGQFQDDCKSYKPTKQDFAFALELSHSMSEFYGDEKGRAENTRKVFGNYGLEFLAAQIDGYTTDGDMRYKDFCIAPLEVKPELCMGKAGPLFEAAWYYVAFMRHQLHDNLRSRLPCLILYAAGKCTCAFRHVNQNLMFLSSELVIALSEFYLITFIMICRLDAKHSWR
jgi:hypothetical protein